MEELRTLVVGGVGIQQQQLQTSKDQLQAFLDFKDQVFSFELRLTRYFLLEHDVTVPTHRIYNMYCFSPNCRL